MSYLITFAPWIVYALLSGSSTSSKQWGALGALAVSVIVLAYQLRRERSYDALIIEFGSAVFFAGFAVLAYAAPHSGALHYSAAMSNAALGIIAWVSVAIRHPFTLGIAKQSTPREFWDQPLFIRTNVIISLVWAASFTVSAAGIAVLTRSGASGIAPAQIAGFAIPMVFTIRYVAIVTSRSRHTAQLIPAGPARGER